jgi:uncharacterized protein (TIGR02246 family)
VDAAAVNEWLDAYGRAWEERDPGAAAALFSEDATYRETPFDEAMRGHDAIRAYWGAEVEPRQEDVRFQHELLAVAGDLVLAWWHASFTRLPARTPAELDGVFALRFDARGRCRELREWWHLREW